MAPAPVSLQRHAFTNPCAYGHWRFSVRFRSFAATDATNACSQDHERFPRHVFHSGGFLGSTKTTRLPGVISWRPHTGGLTCRKIKKALKQLVDYIQRIWIDSNIWPPAAWSGYRLSVRTNNNLEGWHNRLISRGRSQISLYLSSWYDWCRKISCDVTSA